MRRDFRGSPARFRECGTGDRPCVRRRTSRRCGTNEYVTDTLASQSRLIGFASVKSDRSTAPPAPRLRSHDLESSRTQSSVRLPAPSPQSKECLEASACRLRSHRSQLKRDRDRDAFAAHRPAARIQPAYPRDPSPSLAGLSSMLRRASRAATSRYHGSGSPPTEPIPVPSAPQGSACSSTRNSLVTTGGRIAVAVELLTVELLTTGEALALFVSDDGDRLRSRTRSPGALRVRKATSRSVSRAWITA